MRKPIWQWALIDGRWLVLRKGAGLWRPFWSRYEQHEIRRIGGNGHFKPVSGCVGTSRFPGGNLEAHEVMLYYTPNWKVAL